MKGINNLRDEFLIKFGLKEQSEVLQACCTEMLILCLQELRKEDCNRETIEEGLKIDPEDRIRYSSVFNTESSLLGRVLDLAGYWSNDLEYEVRQELEDLKKQGKYSPEDESCDLTVCGKNIFEKIYGWLKSDYGLGFTFNS